MHSMTINSFCCKYTEYNANRASYENERLILNPYQRLKKQSWFEQLRKTITFAIFSQGVMLLHVVLKSCNAKTYMFPPCCRLCFYQPLPASPRNPSESFQVRNNVSVLISFKTYFCLNSSVTVDWESHNSKSGFQHYRSYWTFPVCF